jgi:hypothetical protein
MTLQKGGPMGLQTGKPCIRFSTIERGVDGRTSCQRYRREDRDQSPNCCAHTPQFSHVMPAGM